VTAQTVADTTGGDASRTVSTTYDGYDRPASSTDATGAVTTYGYDTYGDLAKQVDPGGTETDYVHDAEGHLLTTTLVGYTGDPANPAAATNVVESARAYDPAGRLASITDAMGRTTAYTYTDDGLVASITRQDVAPSTTKFVVQSDSYDAAGNLISQTTNNGATTTTSNVDAADRTVSTTVDPAGLKRATSYTFTADDQVATAKLTDASSTWSSVTAGYDAAGHLTSRSLTGSVAPTQTRTTTWTLDRRGLPTAVTDPNGNITNQTYDEAGHLAQQIDPTVNTETGGATPTATRPITTTGYNTFGETAETQDADGNTSTYGYDADGRLTTTTLPPYTPPGATTAITPTSTKAYNSLGQVTSQTDPLGHTTSYTYDQLGDQATSTAPNLAVTHATYDLAGETLSVADGTGALTQATYDYLGRKITSTQRVRQPTPTADTTTYAYAATGGWLSSIKTPTGVTTSRTYDAAGQTTTSVDGAGNTTSYGYDLAGRPTTTTLPDGTRHLTGYDDAGNPTTQSDTDATGTVLRTSSATYDPAGHLTASTDARGTTSTFAYDATGQVTTETQPVTTGTNPTSITTTFGYDAAGNRTRFTDGRGYAWLTTYNTWNLPEAQIDPPTTTYPNLVNRSYTATYDANANITRVDMPGGVAVTNTYDTLGNLTGSSGTGADAPTTARSFGYDAIGRMTSASAPGGSDAFGYDDRGLLTSTTGPSGTSSFTYTPDGLMASRTDAAGTTRYGYDTAGRLATLADAITGTTGTYNYNTLNQPTQINYGTGNNVRSYGYDPLHRLTSDTLTTAAGTTLASISYGYDPNDNITAKTTTGVTGAAANTYTYDAANRLTSWNNGTATVGYSYDTNGNLTKAGTTTYSYNPKNQLINDGTRSYTYSVRGTLWKVTTGTTSVKSTYDAFGQQITNGASSYSYDALGRLTTLNTGTTTLNLTYTGAGNTVASDGTATYSRDPGDGLIGVGTPGGNTLALTDQHSDVIGQFTPNGATLTGSTTYDPFGTVTATTGMKGNLGYQSGWTDPTTNRVNMGSRWYDPTLNRFTSRDSVNLNPVPTSVSANRYAYVNDNPLAGTDPTGTCSWYDVVCGVTKAASAVSSAVSTAWNYTTSYATSAFDSYYSAINWAYSTAVQVTKAVIHTAVHAVKTAVHTVADAYHAVQRRVVHYYHAVRQATSRIYRAAVRRYHAVVHAVRTTYHAVAHIVARAATATAKFVQHHAGTIASVVVGVAVFAGCEAATVGVGSVGCAVLAGAAAGAAGNLADVAAGNTKFSLRGLAVSTGMGALTGWATAGLGSALSGVAGRVASRLAGSTISDALSVGSSRLASSIVGRGAAAFGRGMDTLLAPARAVGTGIRGMIGADTAAVDAGDSALARVTAACGGESFSADTSVLSATGNSVAISRLRPGDKVIATDVKTGKTGPAAVSAVMVRYDRDLYDLQVQFGATSVVIHTTWSHPFWDETRHRWVKAGMLQYGDHLRTPRGGTAMAVGGRTPSLHDGWMWDISVPGPHDFYAAAVGGGILVHNVVCRSLPSNTGATHIALGTRQDIQVVRDWEDTEHEVLTLPRPGQPGGWTPELNDQWVAGAITKRQSAFLASPLTNENIFSEEFPSNRGTTVFGREVFQLLDAGYTLNESETYMFPPPIG
jgi:RHS repeat-associated protein